MSSPLPPPDVTSAIPASASASSTDLSAPTSTSNPLEPGALLTGGASPPLIVGFISVGAFALAIISICAWSKFVRRHSVLPDAMVDRYYRFVPVSLRHGRGREERDVEEEGEQGERGRGRRRWRRRGRERELDGGGAGMGARARVGTSVDLGGKAKPEMFDAWISRRRRSVDIFKKWQTESVPFSATLFTTTTGVVAVETTAAAACAGGDSVEEDDREEKLSMRESTKTGPGSDAGADTTGSRSTLQVAVLLQMPSPRHDAEGQNPIRRDLLGHQGELAIGLIEVPCPREQHYAPERTTS